MTSIVVAFDGSESSRKGLEKAKGILAEGDEIILASIVPTAKIEEMSEMEGDKRVPELRENANQALALLRESGINAVAIIREGDVVEEIIKIAEDSKCSMLVVGGGGVSKIGKFALGSVADQVSRRSKRPVLIVK